LCDNLSSIFCHFVDDSGLAASAVCLIVPGMLSRDDITAALFASGAGAWDWLEEIAHEALGAAEVGPFAAPFRIGVALKYEFRELTHGEVRAFVEGRRISCLWHPKVSEWGLNAFLGLAMARLVELGVTITEAILVRLAGCLALPGRERDLALDLKRQLYLPQRFIAAHHRARGMPSIPPKLVVAR
jgi:hypothetical protein